MKNIIANSRYPMQADTVYSFKRPVQTTSQLLVRVGEEVRPETILFSDLVKSGFRTFNLAEMFKVKNKDAVSLLRRTVGSRVYQGDVIAIKRDVFGFRERVFKSPLNGIIQSYDANTSRLTVQYLPREVKTVAGVYGKVTDILPGEYLSIATLADIINGLISFGVDREGSLIEIGYPDIPLQPEQITEKLNGRIVFGGTKASLDVMYKALAIGVKMVITGGIDYQDYLSLRGTKGRLEDVGVSLIATEGFMAVPIYDSIYKILKLTENRHVIFNSDTASLILPKDNHDLSRISTTEMRSKNDEKPRGFALVKVNDRVRLIFGENAGEYGIVTDIQNTEVVVQLPNTKVTVPGDIVEIIYESSDQMSDG